MTKRSIPFGNAMGMPVAFSNAISVPIGPDHDLIWISGQLAFDEDDRLVGSGDIEAQTTQCIRNIESQLAQFGGGLADVTNVLIFVTSMTGLDRIHQIRRRLFPEPYPASTLVQVTGFVHPDALIEIQAQAVIQRSTT